MSSWQLRVFAGYVAAVVVLGTVAFFFASSIDVLAGPAPSVVAMLTFVALGVALQVTEYRLPVGTVFSSISFIIYFAAALVFGVVYGAAIAGIVWLASELFHRRALWKLAFNIAQVVLSMVVGCSVYYVLGGRFPPTSLEATVGPFGGFVLSFFVVNSAVVSGAIAFRERRQFLEVWGGNTAGTIIYDIVASALGLAVALLYVDMGLKGIAIVVVPILFLRHTYVINQQLQESNRDLLELMVKAIEARDPYTSGHSQRVSELARRLAREVGLRFREIDEIATAALLHDVGKIYEEYAPLLHKDGRLTEAERALMQTHSVRSAELVRTISHFRGRIERYVRNHHENYDGTGYPDGLRGEEIPMGARIIMIADTADAMTTDRPYRRALSYERVIAEFDKYAGRQFDPELVRVFKLSASIRQLVQSRAPAPELGRSLELEKPARVAAR